MEKTYINLVPVMTGGGLQNAINLIIGINDLECDNSKFVFLIRNTKLEEILIEKQMEYIKIEDSIFSRLFYELFFFLGKKGNIIFTLFGGKPLVTYKNFTISGCAYSNLFYPEIDFWGYLSFPKKLIKKLKDIYRFYLIKFSDVVIFETEILKERAIKLKNFKQDRTFVIKMAVNKIVSESNVNSSQENFTKGINKRFKILYLGSSHPNKRQHLLINIVRELKKKNTDFCFITTMQNNSYTKEVISTIEKEELSEFIINIGPVDGMKAGELIKECDAMINIAKLESFSNNFIEAWTLKKLLILTDADWSRDSCKRSALYINPEDSVESANDILILIENKKLQKTILESYEDTLSNYLDYKEKTVKYMELIYKFSGGAKH
jgi:glycosyltransferase involved in cell wall biosynthesis